MSTRTSLRRLTLATLATFALVRVEPARGGGEMPVVSADDLLSARDYVPTRADLDQAMQPEPLQDLVQRAFGGPGGEDIGIRLRAIRALAQYPSDDAHSALLLVLESPDLQGNLAPEEVFVLQRATLEALAELGDPDDVAVITEFLMTDDANPANCDRRDIRAAAAHALRVLGSTTAQTPLRARLAVEICPQVEFAINEALRELLGGT